MSTPPRTPLKATTVETSPRAESYLSSEQLAAIAGISTATLARLVSVGLVEPTPNERDTRRCFRLRPRHDFDGCCVSTATSA